MPDWFLVQIEWLIWASACDCCISLALRHLRPTAAAAAHSHATQNQQQDVHYMTTHLRCRRRSGSGRSTALTASSNTCLRPRWVSAEHSMYLTARTLFASFWPCSRLRGARPCSCRAFSVSRSSRRSILVPGNLVGRERF